MSRRRSTSGRRGVSRRTDEVDRPPRSERYWQLVRQRFLRHRLAVIAVVTLIILIVARPSCRDHRRRGGRPHTQPSRAARDRTRRASSFAPLGYNEIGQNIFAGWPRPPRRVAHHRLRGGPHHRRHRRHGRLDRRLLRRLDRQPADARRRHRPRAAGPVHHPRVIVRSGARDMRVIIIAIGITGWTTAARLVRPSSSTSRGRTTSRRPARSGAALGGSSRAHAAAGAWPRSSSPPRSASPTRSSSSRRCRSSASASRRPRRASATMLQNALEYFTDRTARPLPGHHPDPDRPVRQLPGRRPARRARPAPAGRGE